MACLAWRHIRPCMPFRQTAEAVDENQRRVGAVHVCAGTLAVTAVAFPQGIKVLRNSAVLGKAPLRNPSAKRNAVRHRSDKSGAVHTGLPAADDFPGPLVDAPRHP